jgi:acetylornithine deacetylase/succinyl-diaminopimelate desuccinylase-like protein
VKPILALLVAGTLTGCALRAPAPGTRPASTISAASVRAHMEFLAGDALNGRGSGTRDEWIAAAYVAAHMRRLGLEPLGEDGDYLEAITTQGDGRTWNAVGRLPGGEPALRDDVILLSAHLDHLGNRAARPGAAADSVYNGADDDASGTVAVLELMAALASGPRPKRTLVFALFGSEERGGLGSRHFANRPTVPLPGSWRTCSSR